MADNTLFIRGGGLGDLVLTLPAIADALGTGARITLMGNSTYSSLTGLIPGCEFIPIDSPRTAPLFREAPPLPGSAPHSGMEFLAPFDSVYVFRRRETDPPVPLLRSIFGDSCRFIRTPAPHISAAEWGEKTPLWQYFREQCMSFGPYFDGLSMTHFDELSMALRERASPRNREVMLFPFTGSEMKNWPPPKWIHLAKELERLDLVPVFVIHPETDTAPFLPHTVIRERDLTVLTERFGAAFCCIGGDTGLSQLAGYIGAPLVMLFGPTDPELWQPPGDVRIIRAGNGSTASIMVGEVLEALP